MLAEDPGQVRICVVARFFTCAQQVVRTIMMHSMPPRSFATGRHSLHGTMFPHRDAKDSSSMRRRRL